MATNILNFISTHTPLLYLTQSLWRDEAFSVLMSEHSLAKIIYLTSNDFNPPLYYFLLHFWMKLFGQSQIAIRMLSFVSHVFLSFSGFKLAQKVFKSKSTLLHCYVAALLFFNPMLLYYAFEARMYSLLALFATLSMFFFLEKKWFFYVLFSVLGLYTHPYMVFVLVSQAFYLLIVKGSLNKLPRAKSPRYFEQSEKKVLAKRGSYSRPPAYRQARSGPISLFSFVRSWSKRQPIRETENQLKNELFSFFFIFLFYFPWVPILAKQALKTSDSWIYPVDLNLVMASLGNLFTGFEGTPVWFWPYPKLLSLVIIFFSLLVLQKSFKKGTRSPLEIKGLLFCLWLFIPLSLVLIISFLKPIYVNRYLIFVTIAQVFVIISALETFKSIFLRKSLYFLFFVFCFLFSFWYAPYHQKIDFKTTLAKIEVLARKKDLVYSRSPLTFFEASFYFKDRTRVFVYNPELISIPYYVGKVIIPQEKVVSSLPFYPKKAFIINDDGSFEIAYQKS